MRFSLISLMFLAVACSPVTPGIDAGVPAADAAVQPDLDAGLVIDAGTVIDAGPVDSGTIDAGSSDLFYLPPSTQRSGDPDAGYFRVINDPYVNCGIPANIFIALYGNVPPEKRLAGRTGLSAQLAYNYTASTGKTGIQVVGPNCLTCHAEFLNGQLIIGLGNTTRDYTTDDSPTIAALAQILTDPNEITEHHKFSSRTSLIGPRILTKTRGANPADTLAGVIFSHRNQSSLVWSDTALLPEPTVVLPADVPPWWRMKKKNVMFYTGAGAGDHARLMMSASSLCIDNVADAQAIDATFNDVREYLSSIQPPAYPLAIDTTLAATGEQVFNATCARCHGTKSAYPNLLVALETIGTDPNLAMGGSATNHIYENWFNGSFWGMTAHFEARHGYVAPPLDGIWATAPFLHNGSVPTLRGVIDSSQRPRFWKRSFSTNEYDVANMGLIVDGSAPGHSTTPDTSVYDTTEVGYGNQGHTFGDALTAPERTALLEYLKTL